MFVDEIFFISACFYTNHIFNDLFVLPNVSTSQQYRSLKMFSLSKQIGTFSIFMSYYLKYKKKALKNILIITIKEIEHFKFLLIFGSFSNYVFFNKIFKEQIFLGNLITQNLFVKSITIK
jgi:hypothetical protein